MTRRLKRIEDRLVNIGEGLRSSIECNSAIVRSLDDLRVERGMPHDERTGRAVAAGEAWKNEKDRT